MPLKSIALAVCLSAPLLLCACSDDPSPPPPQDPRVIDFNKVDGAGAGRAEDAPVKRDGDDQQQPNSN